LRLFACLPLCATLVAQTPPDKIFVNAVVLTMDAAGRTAQAVAIRGEQIVSVGTTPEIHKLAGPSTQVVDLGGKTLLPGFYAAHDHFPAAGTVAVHYVDLNSPPIGKMQSIADIVAALQEKARSTPTGHWVVGRGYDDTLLREKRHPTRHDLDQASTRHPIWIAHSSGHLGVANSRALALAGIIKDTPQPQGGLIRKDPESGQPTGVFEEAGSLVSRHIPALSLDQRLESIRWSDRDYLSKGITTAVIAGTNRAGITDLRKALANGLLHLRITAMLSAGAEVPELPTKAAALGSGERLRIGAVKIVQDGSIQGYTAYLTAPITSSRRESPITAATRIARGKSCFAWCGNITAPATRSPSTATATPPSTTSCRLTVRPSATSRAPTPATVSNIARPRVTISSTSCASWA
jgi:predicted amidohydrolase YtcJ